MTDREAEEEATLKERPSKKERAETRGETSPNARRDAPGEGAQAEGDEAHDASDEPAEASSEPSRAKPRKSIFKRPIFWIFILLLLLGIAAAVYYYITQIRPYATTDDAFIGADVVQIAPQVSGAVTEVAVENNSHVKKGDLLVRIDQSSAQANVATAEAGLAEAKAQAEEARVSIEQARNQVSESEASLDALQATAQNDRDTLNRDQRLSKAASGAITQKQVDDAKAAARAATAQAEAGSRSVATAKTAVKVAQAKAQSAEAAVETAKSKVETANITLNHTTIEAPMDGQIVQKNVNTGSFATQGQPMMALVPDQLYVTANYKETQLSDIEIGRPVDLHIDAYPDKTFHGKVVSIQHGAGQAFQLLPPQNATGNFVKVVQRVPVRISIDKDELQQFPIGPGMSVVPSVHTQ
ncbi:HlyD family secretion protein [Pararhizobium mangrovi]|uniref:HlyD family secretion protein n=1 Tax=Pararhizobium mangrovi TaxID=2590452 RepID=UPI0015E839D4|nr:HlyD family secretion protein [Pararhizobium mangrovi]